MSSHRIVITGMSVLTPVGNDLSVVARAFQAEIDSSRATPSVEATNRTTPPTRIDSFCANDHMQVEPSTLRRMDRFSQLAIVSAHHAIRNSGITTASLESPRCGVIAGSVLGGQRSVGEQFRRLHERGANRVSAFMIPSMMVNAASANIAVHWGLAGPSLGIANGATSSMTAISRATTLIRDGKADLMICGSADAYPATIGGPHSETEGHRIGEGAGMLVLENKEHALQRGAMIRAQVEGFGQAHRSASSKQVGDAAVIERAIRMALAAARLTPESISMVVADDLHGQYSAGVETKAVAAIFGETDTPQYVSRRTSEFGRLQGAAGVVATALAIETAGCSPNLDSKIGPNVNSRRLGPRIVNNQSGAGSSIYLLQINRCPESGHCCSVVFSVPV